MKNTIFQYVAAGATLFALFAVPTLIFAQTPDAREEGLRKLYELSVQQTDSSLTLTQRKIDVERTRAREAFTRELEGMVESLTKQGSGETLDVSRAFERQRNIVETLETQLKEAEVDLALLQEEEAQFYGDTPTASGSLTDVRLTQTHPELLAKKTLFEERIAALHLAIGPQQERLQRLSFEQQLDQFSSFIGIAKYIVILLVIVILERFIRRTVLGRIKNRNHRYRAMKFFAAGVYILLALWLIGKLSADQPGIVTSFAIVGAGIAVALQDVIKDAVGWVIILQKRLYGLGHRISIGNDITGDVMDIGLLWTTLLEVASPSDTARTGKTLYVPNSFVLNRTILNYNTTSDFVETELSFTVDHGSDWKRAEQILREILKEEVEPLVERARMQSASRTQFFYLSQEMKGTRIFLEVTTKGLVFTLRFPVPIGERRVFATKLTTKVLERFAGENPPIELRKDA